MQILHSKILLYMSILEYTSVLLLFILVVVLNFLYIAYYKRKCVKDQQIRSKQLEETNLKLLESEANLKAMNSTKDHLFSIISHDLRSPFNSLLGLSEILCNNSERMEQANVIKYANFININARSLYEQVESLLEWSRMQTNSIKYKPEPIELRLLVLNVFTLFELMAFRKNIDLICEVPSGVVAFADHVTVTAVLRNLTDNAIKFTKEGGKVIVSSKKNDKFVEITVTDSGMGMSNTDIDKLFQIDTVFTRRGTSDEKGSGLGLITCKEFVRKNGGEISVSSQLSVGSSFKFTLPTLK
jgi:signal transduction histidine kinase